MDLLSISLYIFSNPCCIFSKVYFVSNSIHPVSPIFDAVRLEEEIKSRDVKIQELETDQDRKIMNLEFIVSELSKRLESKLKT